MNNVWKYALIASLGGFLFGFETAVISGAEQIIQRLWALDAFWHGLTVSISLIGTIFGRIASWPHFRSLWPQAGLAGDCFVVLVFGHWLCPFALLEFLFALPIAGRASRRDQLGGRAGIHLGDCPF